MQLERVVHQRFLKAWPRADANLPEIAHAEKFVEAGTQATR